MTTENRFVWEPGEVEVVETDVEANAEKSSSRADDEDASMCPDCGELMPRSDTECPGCGYAVKCCDACGSMMGMGAGTCPQCGCVMNMEAAEEREDVSAERADFMDDDGDEACPVCGESVDEDDDECPWCGTDLDEYREDADWDDAAHPRAADGKFGSGGGSGGGHSSAERVAKLKEYSQKARDASQKAVGGSDNSEKSMDHSLAAAMHGAAVGMAGPGGTADLHAEAAQMHERAATRVAFGNPGHEEMSREAHALSEKAHAASERHTAVRTGAPDHIQNMVDERIGQRFGSERGQGIPLSGEQRERMVNDLRQSPATRSIVMAELSHPEFSKHELSSSRGIGNGQDPSHRVTLTGNKMSGSAAKLGKTQVLAAGEGHTHEAAHADLQKKLAARISPETHEVAAKLYAGGNQTLHAGKAEFHGQVAQALRATNQSSGRSTVEIAPVKTGGGGTAEQRAAANAKPPPAGKPIGPDAKTREMPAVSKENDNRFVWNPGELGSLAGTSHFAEAAGRAIAGAEKTGGKASLTDVMRRIKDQVPDYDQTMVKDALLEHFKDHVHDDRTKSTGSGRIGERKGASPEVRAARQEVLRKGNAERAAIQKDANAKISALGTRMQGAVDKHFKKKK